ncbi:MAG TPA: DNA-3-methyladenine glycosylase 2 family protein [Candidatus Marinimicrobia bacterium]|nr:DNA-3-methyladenine glycosylase 2 family protein [Candidatus Neomarinimicrobiota bacterium]|tara:strand:+ start:267 stop:884 length:618 start_codon:yes stop_codon:yes gene_type:complete
MKNILTALKYLKKTEPRFGTLIDEFGEPDFELQDNYFKSLVRSIIYQQLSGKSAFAIYNRYLQLFNSTEFPSPQQVLAIPDSHYKSIGLSRQKTCYIKEISQAFSNKEIIPENIPKMKDDEVRKQFIKIKGIGPWTIDMFLMFTLNRPDILPVNDLGIQKGFKSFFSLNELPDENFMVEKSEKWKPFRTIACWYLWKLVDDNFQW